MKSQNRSIVLFFVLTFLFTWLLHAPTLLVANGILPAPFDMKAYASASLVVGAFGPLLASIVLLKRSSGWGAVRNLFSSAFDFRVKPLYLLAAITLPLVVTAGAHYFVRWAALDVLPDSFGLDDLAYPVIFWAIPAFLAMMVFGGGQEEFGWRGYAQEPMQERFGVVNGSIAIGALWGTWHLPLWFVPGDPHAAYPFIAFIIFTMAFSVQIGWLYNASGKKLLVPWILHSANNTVIPIFPVYNLEQESIQVGAWVYVGVNVLVAIVIAATYTRTEEKLA